MELPPCATSWIRRGRTRGSSWTNWSVSWLASLPSLITNSYPSKPSISIIFISPSLSLPPFRHTILHIFFTTFIYAHFSLVVINSFYYSSPTWSSHFSNTYLPSLHQYFPLVVLHYSPYACMRQHLLYLFTSLSHSSSSTKTFKQSTFLSCMYYQLINVTHCLLLRICPTITILILQYLIFLKTEFKAQLRILIFYL